MSITCKCVHSAMCPFPYRLCMRNCSGFGAKSRILRRWFKVDVDITVIFCKKNIHVRIVKLSLHFKIFPFCTNIFFPPSSWQVADASSLEGFILTA